MVTLVECADRPRFRCGRSHGAQLDAVNATITCVVRHNPEPSELYVSWRRHGGHHRVDATANSLLDDKYRLSTSVSIMQTCISGVATVGARVSTFPPTSVVRLAQIRRVFWRSGLGVGGSRLRMSLKVHRLSSVNTSRKCVCPLHIVGAQQATLSIYNN